MGTQQHGNRQISTASSTTCIFAGSQRSTTTTREVRQHLRLHCSMIRSSDFHQAKQKQHVAGVVRCSARAQGVVVAATFTDAQGNWDFSTSPCGAGSAEKIQPKGYFDSGDHQHDQCDALTGYYAANDVIAGIALLNGPTASSTTAENLPVASAASCSRPHDDRRADSTTFSDVLADLEHPRRRKLPGDDIAAGGAPPVPRRRQLIFDVNGNLVEYTTTFTPGSTPLPGWPRFTCSPARGGQPTSPKHKPAATLRLDPCAKGTTGAASMIGYDPRRSR